MKLLASIFLPLVIGCQSIRHTPTDAETLACNSQDLQSAEIGRIGDPRIHQGRLYRSDTEFEFRPCNKDELYLVDASFSIHEKLDQYISVSSSAGEGPMYVRFRGLEIQCVVGLPSHYANAVKVEELLALSSALPAQCD